MAWNIGTKIKEAVVGDDYTETDASHESNGIDLVFESAIHGNAIEVYGNRALRDVLVELVNENADRINLALKENT